MISDTISKQIGEAMKAKEEVRLSTLKMLSSALNYEFINKQHPLSVDEELAVVKHEAKKRKEAIEAYRKAGANDRADREEQELKILKEYLPEDLSRGELERLVNEAISETGASKIADMGKVIGAVMAKSKGIADGGEVAALVREKLS